MLHGRHFFFFNHFYVYRIDGVPPGNLLVVRNFLFFSAVLLFKSFGIEVFWREIDQARLWPWLWLLYLSLFVHLPMLALLSIFSIHHLFPASDFFQRLLSTLVVFCMLLVHLFIRSAKFERSSRIASSGTDSIYVSFCFLISIETHAWALNSRMKRLISLFDPQILKMKVIRDEKLFFACRLVAVDSAAIQLVKNVRQHLNK